MRNAINAINIIYILGVNIEIFHLAENNKPSVLELYG
jgi:hypothetical protein